MTQKTIVRCSKCGHGSIEYIDKKAIASDEWLQCQHCNVELPLSYYNLVDFNLTIKEQTI